MILKYASDARRNRPAPLVAGPPPNVFNNVSPELEQRNQEVNEAWNAIRERMDQIGFIPQIENGDMFQMGGFELLYNVESTRQRNINIDPNYMDIGDAARPLIAREQEGHRPGLGWLSNCACSWVGGNNRHSNDGQLNFRCHFCGRMFRTLALMKEHERFTHGVHCTAGNVCLLCHAVFEDYDAVVAHFITFNHDNPTLQGSEQQRNPN